MPETISVIIPTFNRASDVVVAVESVLSQASASTEVIVVDDGSKDNTREVVESFGSSVRYVYQENQGLPASRNTGMREAEYDIFLFLDALFPIFSYFALQSISILWLFFFATLLSLILTIFIFIYQKSYRDYSQKNIFFPVLLSSLFLGI